jgi:hypothetical protein
VDLGRAIPTGRGWGKQGVYVIIGPGDNPGLGEGEVNTEGERAVKRYIVRDALAGVTFATTEVLWTSAAPRHRSLSRAQARKVARGESASSPGSQTWGWDPRGGKKKEGCFRPVEIVGEVEIDISPVAKWAKVKWRECRSVEAARWNDVVEAVHEEILRELDLGPDVALSFGQGTDAAGWRSATLFFPSTCCW